MSTPTVEQIPRRGRGTGAGGGDTPTVPDHGPAAWSDLERLLVAGEATTWLSVRASYGVHTRPVFAAWTGSAFVLVSNAGAAKTALLEDDGRVSLAFDLGPAHLSVDGTATRLRDPDDLERAATAMRRVYDWPAEVSGEELDAPYGAPTSGGPPFRAYQVRPWRAFAFPTADAFEPTRLLW